MLLRLAIRDFILVDALELEFARGFGTLTGETGAGKSILIDALSFVLGERADVGLIRSGAERAEVVAVFDVSAVPGVRTCLQAQDIDGDGELLLRRVVDANGRSRAYLNGTPTTLQAVREVSAQLLDIHGQHAHQSLLHGEVQQAIVDAFGGLQDLCGQTAALWRNWRQLRQQWQAALAGGAERAREREQLEAELRELAGLGLAADEWTAINEEQARLAHASSLGEGAQFAVASLSDGEPACASMLAAVAQRLDEMSGHDARLVPLAALLRSAQAEVDEAAAQLRRYADSVELDPARLDEVDRRIGAILACARKFRVAPGDLPGLLHARQRRLAELVDDADAGALARAVDQAGNAYAELAAQLSAARRGAAERLSREVSATMQELALAGGRFEVALLPLAEGGAGGQERIEFQVAGLAGETSRPLAKVASGGELSRISLAIQVVASQAASVPTLVFDEVDVGIGGGVAEVVGRLLKTLGVHRQVLCVTHLPQVAARADWQWQVAKIKAADGFRSAVLALDAGGRVEEIARMLGGVDITPLTRQHAREMLGAS